MCRNLNNFILSYNFKIVLNLRLKPMPLLIFIKRKEDEYLNSIYLLSSKIDIIYIMYLKLFCFLLRF